MGLFEVLFKSDLVWSHKFSVDTCLISSTIEFHANTFVFAQDQNIIPSNGFTIEGFLRGLLGISFLILTTYLLSNNKKAIKKNK